jgi:predicted site-specific integrase-resolvase
MVKDAVEQALTKVPSSMAARVLGIDRLTLYKWRDRGEIACERTASGRILWNVAAYLKRQECKAA